MFHVEDLFILSFFIFSEEYERHKYIQIHNKFESVRLEAVKNGRVVPMNREISKMCKFIFVKKILQKNITQKYYRHVAQKLINSWNWK